MKDYSNQSFNDCSFVKELPPKFSAAGNKRRIAEWKCRCGKLFIAAICNVTSGQVKSCGCGHAEANVTRCTKHGHSPMRNGDQRGGTKLYRFWQSMKDRCLNSGSRSYKRYGQRGIKMHEPWRDSFENFREWFNRQFGLDDVPANLTMDRRENDGNYDPGNLRLATMEVQANNRSNNHIVIYNGQKLTVAQLAKRIGMKQKTLGARLNRGVPLEQAIL